MRYRHTHNPLPPPPQPLPLDRFPSLTQQFPSDSTAHSQPFSYTTNGYRSRDDYGQDSNTNGIPYANTMPLADGMKNGKSPGVHANGYQNPSQRHVVNGVAHAPPMFVPDSTSGVGSSRSRKRSKGPVGRDGRSEERVSTDRAGPSRNQSAPTPQHYAHARDEAEFSQNQNTPTSQPYTQPQNKYPYIASDLFGIGRAVDQTTHNNRARIIPGASPTKRIIPPRVPPLPKFIRDGTQKFIEQSPERPRDRQSRRHRDDDRRRSFQGMDELASRVSGHHGLAASLSDGEDDIENRLVSASAFVSGYGSGYDEGYGYASTYRHGYMPSRSDGYAVPRSDSSDDGVGGLGLLDIPRNPVVAEALDQADGVDDMTTPRARHAEPHRRRSNSTSEWRSIDLLTLPPSGRLRETHRTLDEVLGTDGVQRETRPRDPSVEEARQNVAGRNSMNSMNSSVSSWGTVQTSVRGSMSDLGLIGLHRGGVTGQGSVAEGAHSTPMFTRDLEGEDEAGGTPRMSMFARRVPLGLPVDTRAARLQVDNERSRHSRSLSHPEISLPLDESNDSHHNNQAIRPPHSRQHSLTQSVSLDSGTHPPSIYGSQPTANALDLTFDGAVPSAVDTTRETTTQIRAPAPRMGGPNVLDLWRSQA
ncbi:hypothetical protein PILCRDRAFT_506303 [Piloderma croceum F 1598]|uniref:Uncharacterized protein n=1 Tax=Piloderma croceum (strain F 1598) TaxID=765440 RepID=A0A0C3B4X2_PILCF|nr:hypothetical protein PILCRDRAFT_506303 [Piloderma croceum F 1598]